ncbi:uncharacterized protein KY384_007927 [Bacidia gigantensis]|uniref:uncharacterized protein n=1 Tax=Bacidia gigantensis TaxID=2732470 RepID=UPI001D05BC64|nr:uncharacterized protein KY384_007927 [Bacidia gigantensis]KAG8527773.1 hypothetical protein KY384_007927 [Bacidia gigantensis]
MSKQLFGNKHSKTALAFHNLATCYTTQGQHKKAISLETQVMDITEEQHGRTHPQTLEAMARLAAAFESADRYLDSLSVRSQLSSRACQVFNRDHPARLSAMEELAFAYDITGQYDLAVVSRQECYRLAKAIFGSDHATSLRNGTSLKFSCENAGRREDAMNLKEEIRQMQNRIKAAKVSNETAGNKGASQSLVSPTAPGDYVSDAESSSSTDSVFLPAPSDDTISSVEYDHFDDVASAWTRPVDDHDLLLAYEDLVLLMGKDAFIRKHTQLLKKFLDDVSLENPPQRTLIAKVNRRGQRRAIGEYICNVLLNSPMTTNVSGPTLKEAPSYEPLQWSLQSETMKSIDITEALPSADEVCLSPASEENFSNADDVNLSGLPNLLHSLLTSTPALENYSDTLKTLSSSLCCPHRFDSVLKLGDLNLAQGLLERHFDALATGDLEWLWELRSLGYGSHKIAELLLDDQAKSPWIVFSPPPAQSISIRPDFHVQNCVHWGGQEHSLAPRLNTIQFQKPEDTRRIIAEHCGIAGIIPHSRDYGSWTGSVNFFDGEELTVAITYAMPGSARDLVVRICDALRRFCCIASYLQEKHLSCNSFTILCHTVLERQPVVELQRIEFQTAFSLFVVLSLLLNNWDSPSLITRCLPRLKALAHQILSGVCGSENPVNGDSFPDCLNQVALAAQVLNLGLYLFSQAHIGILQPFFLLKSLSRIHLFGAESPKEPLTEAPVRLEPINLTCMAGVTGGHVNVFKSTGGGKLDFPEQRLDLFSSPVDLAETWDAWRFVKDTNDPNSENILAVEIAEGFVSFPDELDGPEPHESAILRLHWSADGPFDFKRSFNLRTKALIGTNFVNPHCQMDQQSSFIKSNAVMEHLGAHGSYWERSELQLGVQGGQYGICVPHMAWAKRPRKTVKHINLGPIIDMSFLESDWGLQISYCTGLARRVSLCQLLSDVIPMFIGDLLQAPQGWNILQQGNSMVDALRSNNFKAWFDELAADLQNDTLKIIRYVLLVLQDTGIDHSGDFLMAVWPQKDNPRACFKIPCKEVTLWARMLQDSPTCATFAYITPLCIETNEWKCQGLPIAPWYNRSAILNTAVRPHATQKSGMPSRSEWTLRHEQSYLIDTPDRSLIGKVTRSFSPMELAHPTCLDVSKSKIPPLTRLRMTEYLREKQSLNDQAQVVVVLTNISYLPV